MNEFRQKAIRPDLETLARVSARCAEQNLPEDQAFICGAMVWAAFSAPGGIHAVFDAIAPGYVTSDLTGAFPQDLVESPLPDSFWQTFEETLTGPAAGYDAGSITATVAALGGAVDLRFHQLAESCAVNYAGLEDVSHREVPGLIALEELSACPPDSLGDSLHHMLVDNGYDPEVLDRDAIGLGSLPPALRYLNTRILQMHDAWHLVAGYETTALHEIAISAFQLAQFPHNYSAMFLATIATMTQRRQGDGFNLIMTAVAEAWVHGRKTPPLMNVPFESEWSNSIDDIRQRYGILPFTSRFPADLFEQLRQTA